MGISTRVLLAVVLATSLVGVAAPHPPHPAAALALRGTVFVGTVTCTLDNSFVHIRTIADGHTTQTEERTLDEHARTTFVLAQGKPIVGTGTYFSRYTTKFTDTTSDIQDWSERTERGSFSGSIEQPNDFNGFELNRPTELLVYTLQIPVTLTYAQYHETEGHVLARNDPPRPQGPISYPDRHTPLPVLTVSEGRPALSGGVSRDVIDSETKKVDGRDGCTWSVLVVLFNGKPFAGSGPSTASDPTRTPTRTPTPTPTALQGRISDDISVTDTPTATSTATSTRTPTVTATQDVTATDTRSVTPTRTPTGTASPTDTPTATATPACTQKGAASAGGARSVPAAAPPVCTPSPYTLDWIMPERYGRDWNGDGLIDYPVSPQRLNVTSDYPNTNILIDPPNWPVKLVVSQGSGLPCDPVATYTWHADGLRFVPEQVLDGGRRTCTFIHIFDAQGPYRVTVDVSKGRYPPGQAQRTVVVRDILIVGLGDSVGSGEGDPDLPAVLNLKRAIWQKAQCHRSAWSYEALAAARIEQADPHTSVTFVHLACSGATITRGLIGDYAGIEPTLGPPLFPQIDRMETIIGRRRPDAVVISIGANDVGFGGIVAACSLKTYLQPCAKQPTLDSVAPLDDKGQPLSSAVPKRLALLPALYNQLAVRLGQAGIPPGKVFLTEYFDPTHGPAGRICSPVLGMTSADLQWAYDHVVHPLNVRVEAAATLHQWTFVDGISAGFRDRGYCTGTASWIVPILGIDLKGTLLKELRPSGTFHPNEEGQAFIARRLVRLLKRSISINGDPQGGVPTSP